MLTAAARMGQSLTLAAALGTSAMKLLITGFEPFGGHAANPSEQLARALAGADAACAVLPVDRERGPRTLLEALRREDPSAVLCLGLAAGRTALSVEQVAVNLLEYPMPDNAGNQVIDQPVAAGGPAAYFATLPTRQMVAAIRAAGVPAELSLSAGAFLCNQVMYTLLHHAAVNHLSLVGGFLHVPALAAMDFETQLRGVKAAVNLILSE